jgi:hypothetical protein
VLCTCHDDNKSVRTDHDDPVVEESTPPEVRERLAAFESSAKGYWRIYCDQARDEASRAAALSSLSQAYARVCGNAFDIRLDTKGCIKTTYITCRGTNPAPGSDVVQPPLQP